MAVVFKRQQFKDNENNKAESKIWKHQCINVHNNEKKQNLDKNRDKNRDKNKSKNIKYLSFPLVNLYFSL